MPNNSSSISSPTRVKCPAQEQGLRRGAQPGCEGQQRCRRSTRGAEDGSIPEVAEGKPDVPLLTCLSDIGYANVKLTAHLLIPLWVMPVDFLKGSQSTQQKTRNPNNSASDLCHAVFLPFSLPPFPYSCGWLQPAAAEPTSCCFYCFTELWSPWATLAPLKAKKKVYCGARTWQIHLSLTPHSEFHHTSFVSSPKS